MGDENNTAVADIKETASAAGQKFLDLVESLNDSKVEAKITKAELIGQLPQASDAEFDALVDEYKVSGTTPDWLNSLEVNGNGNHYGRRLGVRQTNALKKIKAARKAHLATTKGRGEVDGTIKDMTCVAFSVKSTSQGKLRVNAAFEK